MDGDMVFSCPRTQATVIPNAREKGWHISLPFFTSHTVVKGYTMRTREPRNGLERLSRKGNGHDSALHRVPSDVKIDVLVSQEKQRLTAELGITDRVVVHAARPSERPFTRAERPFTTVLFGGLTWKHERLIQAMMVGHGYIAEYLPTPTVKAFQMGKEYGNNGQCNPTYFTVGNLVEYLVALEGQGMSRREIIDKYVFFTAGACGPCRFVYGRRVRTVPLWHVRGGISSRLAERRL
jgi:hypothetical protein